MSPAQDVGKNYDAHVVAGFGSEWSRFDQQQMDDVEAARLFERYFAIFPWASLPEGAEGFDAGCGSGRWARFVAARTGTLHCVDASAEALSVAKSNLAVFPNCRFHLATVDSMPLQDASQDFGYSLGVLHHIPDTFSALQACARKLKPGAPFLLYLYYAFDNRPQWFRAVWRASDLARRFVSHLPNGIKTVVCDAVALLVYWPFARFARVAAACGLPVAHFPLAAYREQSFYVMRTDALDRFGTRLEQRFTREEMMRMMTAAGLREVRFHDDTPFWVAVGRRESGSSGQAEPASRDA
jgi:ubiquinone/menaquinone biosynthesis C-methylase UbiE